MKQRPRAADGRPAVPVGGGVPIDPATGERFGYLPRKAAQRKIIIRRTLGLPWVMAAIGAALLIGVTGAAFLLSDPGRPPSRYADEGTLAAYPAGAVTALRSRTGWVDRRASVLVWLTREPYCPADGGWGSGTVRWDATGAAARNTLPSDTSPIDTSPIANIPSADVQVAQGRLYVDPSRSRVSAGAAGAALNTCPAPQAVDQ